jgi:DNA modification methylase
LEGARTYLEKLFPPAEPNLLYYGDNLDVLALHVQDESVDLIYLDPPFNSKRNYNVIFARDDTYNSGEDAAQIKAFDDTWHWTPDTDHEFRTAVSGGVPAKVADALTAMRTLLGENDAMAYLVNMAPRIVELHRVLKRTGTLYLHCDPTMSHYLKVLLDSIFSPQLFRNEIVWCYAGGGIPKKDFPRKHDTLLRYTKSDDYYYSPIFRPYSEGTQQRGRTKVKGKYFEQGLRPEGTPVNDWWPDISKITSPTDPEKLGYPTQKSEALLDRVLQASSEAGDVVLDPFCGCGTTIAVAEQLGRRWVGIDITYLAVDLIEKRLQHTFGGNIANTYEVHGIPRDLQGAQALFDNDTLDFERWAVSLVSGTPNEKQVGDRGVDGVIRFFVDAKGGTGRALVSVKGGKSIGPQFVRDLLGTVETQKADMGVLVTMANPTRGIRDAADHAGYYTWPVSTQTFPRIQLITIAELLEGKRPSLPPTLTPYIPAKRLRETVDQMALT